MTKREEELLKFNQELLEKIKLLNSQIVEKENIIESKDQEINIVNNKLDVAQKELSLAYKKIHELNIKIEELIKEANYVIEKRNIEHIKQFVPNTETSVNIINEVEEIIKEEKKKKKVGMKKGGKKHPEIDYESLVKDTIYLESEEEYCPKCGEKLIEVSENVRYVVKAVKTKLEVIKIVKKIKACPKCNKEDNTIYYPVLNDPFSGTIITPSFASFILEHKYYLGIPFNRLSKYIKDTLYIDISKQSLAQYSLRCAEILTPIYEKMKYDLLNNEVKAIHSDETTLVVSKKDDENRKKSYVYVYRSSLYDKNRIMIYSFNETRGIAKTADWLSTFKGIIICDDYAGYTSLAKNNKNIKLQRCMVHARRKFADILKGMNRDERKKTMTYKIFNEFSKIYEFEARYKEEKLSPLEIEKRRKEDQLCIKDRLYQLIFNNEYQKNTSLYNAVTYVKGIWNDLWTYLDNGFIEPDNNACERAVKPFVVQRKVFQASGSNAGAEYTTKLFSIIQTALDNKLDLSNYLTYILENSYNLSPEKLVPYSKEMKDLFLKK